MVTHVNIGEAKTRLSQLVAAAVRGEEVVLDRAGQPQVRLVPVEIAEQAEVERRGAKRRLAFGMWKGAFDGFDTSLPTLKPNRADPDERFRRKFGPAD